MAQQPTSPPLVSSTSSDHQPQIADAGGGPPVGLSSLLDPTEAEVRSARRLLQVKAVAIIAVVVASYVSLVFGHVAIWVRLVSAVELVVSLAAVGTGIMHDANHGAFSRFRRVNRIMGCTLDLLGGSSWVWRTKHNKLHHANTNVVGIDTDIDQAPFARMAPQQPWRPWHRYQHLYMWPLYGVMALRMVFFADFAAVVRNQVGTSSFTGGHRSRALIAVAAGKMAHLAWALVIPLAFHPWWQVLIFYLVCSWCLGLMLAVTFQLAHCVSEATFVAPDAEYRGRRFAVHQLATTVNVHCGVPGARHAFRFLMGGLDFQIEHHLAPGLPHTLYPMMARRVARECQRQNLPYRRHPSVTAALRSHARWLKQLGTPADSTMA